MLAMNRTDRVALHATINQAMDSLFPMIAHAEARAHNDGTGDILELVADIRKAAAAITERRHAHAGATVVEGFMADIAMILRGVAASIEACVFEPLTSTGDWQAAADHTRAEWTRLHGQRTLMCELFPASW